MQYILSDFGPATVPASDSDPAAGSHTWDEYRARTQGRPTTGEAHAMAMAAATARVPLPPAGGSNMGATGRTSATAATSSSSSPSSSATGGVAQVIAAAGGDPVAALEGSLRRERALRREIEGLQRAAGAARVASSTAEGHLRSQAEEAQRAAKAAAAAAAALAQHAVGPLAEAGDRAGACYASLQRAINELGTALALAEARLQLAQRGDDEDGDGGYGGGVEGEDRGAGEDAQRSGGGVTPEALTAGLHAAIGRYPALRALVDSGRATDVALASLTSAVQAAATLGGKKGGADAEGGAGAATPSATARRGRSAPSSPRSPKAGGDGGFTGYSSLAAANGAHAGIGSLGASGRLLPPSPRAAAATAGQTGRGRSPSLGSVLSLELPQPSSGSGSGHRAPSSVPFSGPAHLTGSTEPFSGVRQVTASQLALSRAPKQQQQPQTAQQPESPRQPPSQQGAPQPKPSAPAVTATAALAAARGLPRKPEPAPAPASSASASSAELSVADTLRRLFDLYASASGSASGSGSSPLLSCGCFYGLLRDAGMEVGQADAAGHAARASSDSSGAGGMPYDGFVTALNAAAQGAFRSHGSVGAASGLSEADAFRILLQQHVLPLYTRLNAAGALSGASSRGGVSVPGGPAASARLALLHSSVTPEVAAWLGGPGSALKGVFASYADASAPGADASAPPSLMTRRALSAWATDFKLAPPLLSRGELQQLADTV